MAREKDRFETLKIAFRNKKFVFGFGILVSFIVFAIIGPMFTPFAPNGWYYQKVPGTNIKVMAYSMLPSRGKYLPPMTVDKFYTYHGIVRIKHYLGTDADGADLYTQLVYGLRSTLIIAAIAAVVGTLLGISIGFVSGYKGGWADEALMMFVNIMLVMPAIVLLILIAAYLSVRSIWVEGLIIGLTNWPWVARGIRAQTLSLKNREFVSLAKIAGISDIKIIFEEIMPNMSSYVVMSAILQFSSAILTSATLDFIGLGPTTTVSLGTILQKAIAKSALTVGAWWWFIPPGLIITVMITGLFFVNLGLEEVFNPRLRGG